MKKNKAKNYINMRRPARSSLMILAVFLIVFCSGFSNQNEFIYLGKSQNISKNVQQQKANSDLPFFNPLNIPEVAMVPAMEPAIELEKTPDNQSSDNQSFDLYSQVETARDPRFELRECAHLVPFIPASEVTPPKPSISIPIVDQREPMHYDINEWEEDIFFSSNLYTDTAFYTTGISGNKNIAPFKEGEFYEENYRYELFSSGKKKDTLSLLIDGTFTNDKSNYNHHFMLNQFTFDVANDRSRLVLGHAFPEMSELTMNQNLLGIYGSHKFDTTGIYAFGGYYATEKEDLRNPRYTGGVRLEHHKDDSLKLGLNIIATEDERDNAASTLDQPTLANNVVSIDVKMKPTENIFLNAEVARSDTDFDKRDDIGGQEGTAYIFKGGYERENFRTEAGIEYADTEFATPLGESPRDDRSYYARFYYELNKYISTKIGYKESRDNIANYLRSTIVRKQDEIQLTIKPSEYYKNLKIDFYYQPIHEYSRNTGFMDRYIDLLWLEFNQKAGEMIYYAGFSKTIDRDDIDFINDRDINRMDLNLTWESDDQHKVYGSYSIENIDYKRANNTERSTWSGLGGSTKINENLSLGLDYQRENVNASGIVSTHDKLNLSLTREYNQNTRLIIDLSGSRTDFENSDNGYDDYTAKLRLLKTF